VKELEVDFRYKIEAEDASVDVLLSLEVMEHIKDHDHHSFDDLVLFNYSGVKSFISEMARIVRMGGSLILTTPNACSLYGLEQIYAMKTPWLFPPHVRE
jgi:2-polyprenyl-3-methyl-5-hydroxy-6-metoxy-1,4-benzoquinol methylase